MSRSFDTHSSLGGKPWMAPTNSSHGSAFSTADLRRDMERRRMRTQRAQSAQSSRGSGSIDCFLIEHFTSSDSASEEGEPPPNPPVNLPTEAVPRPIERSNPALSLSSGCKSTSSVNDEKGSWASRLMDRAQHAILKHRAKILFAKLVSGADDSKSEAASKRRRQAAASGLLEIALHGSNGKDIIARRFVKTASREEQGIRALLRLNDEELEPCQVWLWEEPPHPIASTAIDLMQLVILRSTEDRFFRRTLPNVLHDARRGVGAILGLVDKYPEFFSHVSHARLFKFGKRFLEQTVPLTGSWCRGVRLLFKLLDRLPGAPLTTRCNIHLPLLRALLQSCVEGFLWADRAALHSKSVDSTNVIQLLKLIFRVLREVGDDLEALDMIAPPRSTLNRLISVLLTTFAPEKCIQQGHISDETALLALKSLAVLMESPIVRKNADVSVVARWAGLFVDIVLRPACWQGERSTGELARAELRPETSAFDILCYLPEPAFANALAFALSLWDPQTTPLTSPPYKTYRVIESLLWLSNTRRHFWKTSLALIEGGACEYLARVLACDDPQSRSHRTFWRAKGLAMTCLGNIMERLDGKELRLHVSKAVIDRVVGIKEDCDAPTVQKGQAIFMLQRYTHVATQCGVEPFYKEDISPRTAEFPSTIIGA